MKSFLTLAFSLVLSVAFGQKHVNEESIIAKELGDLDKDGIKEMVIVYNTSDTTKFGIIRNIQVLKKKKNAWVVWKESKNAIIKSEDGGMMGDPFVGIKIKKGILLVEHFGGSSWKWGYTDKYRFQNGEFELIGYTSESGHSAVEWTRIDFNLSTGKLIYKKEYFDDNFEVERTEEETFYKKGVKINLNNKHVKRVSFKSTVNQYEVSL